MNREEFLKEYYEFFKQAVTFSEIARREGLLALEDKIDVEKEKKREIFNYGLRFVMDGNDYSINDKILSNIINQEKDEYSKLLMIIKKEAVLSLSCGENTRLLIYLLNSYTDQPLDAPEMQGILKD